MTQYMKRKYRIEITYNWVIVYCNFTNIIKELLIKFYAGHVFFKMKSKILIKLRKQLLFEDYLDAKYCSVI